MVQCVDPLVNSVSSESERGREEKRGQQSDLKWKKEERRGEERESLKAYLGNVQGQLSSDECCSHPGPLLNPSLSSPGIDHLLWQPSLWKE